MNLSLAAKSLVLFGISVFILILLTGFESALLGMPVLAERSLSAVLLILPATVGVVFGILSLRRNEMKTGMAIVGVALNALFAIFHILVLTFAG